MEENASDATAVVIENIMTRTSIRQFTDQPVAKDTLDLIVKAGMAAPSAVNAQPWGFIVVTEREVLDSLNTISPYYNLKTATAAIIVCGDLTKAMEGDGQAYWVQDCSAASENILLAAHAYGLGAVWCGVYPIEERVAAVRAALDIPENIIPLNIITMGYPDQNPEPKDKFKADNIHYQKW
ncbi:MAG: nitroreductase family protein [Muribaculaceae bacterium]|nr:nitroreductase family protein [Muribaculaceae bacterium]